MEEDVPSTPGSGGVAPTEAGPGPLSSDPRGVALELLRIGMGVIWSLNLLFVIDPSNRFFPTFQSVALSFAPTSLGGPGVADFVASHSTVFAWMVAVLTAYLAVALVLGLTTRLACVVGIAASVAFLVTQFASTFGVPGGTDVGPHPLYILVYGILLIGHAGRYVSLDRRLAAVAGQRFPRLVRWLLSHGT